MNRLLVALLTLVVVSMIASGAGAEAKKASWDMHSLLVTHDGTRDAAQIQTDLAIIASQVANDFASKAARKGQPEGPVSAGVGFWYESVGLVVISSDYTGNVQQNLLDDFRKRIATLPYVTTVEYNYTM